MRFTKVYILLVSLLAIQSLGKAQTNVNDIDSLVAKLSWKSVSMACVATVFVLTHADSTEKALVKIGKPATAKLIEALDDTSKTVIAHIVLTQIWGGLLERRKFSETYIYKDWDHIIGSQYLYNELVWEYHVEGGETISRSEVDKIKRYWVEKLVDKQRN